MSICQSQSSNFATAHPGDFFFILSIVNLHHGVQTRHFKIMPFDLLFAHCVDNVCFPGGSGWSRVKCHSSLCFQVNLENPYLLSLWFALDLLSTFPNSLEENLATFSVVFREMRRIRNNSQHFIQRGMLNTCSFKDEPGLTEVSKLCI